jgi:uncharacterized protein YbjT (DUF2867 family)
MSGPILVTGATGQQGGIVVESLLEKGLKVRAITRNPESAKAKALKEKGVEVFQGDLEHPLTITKAAEGVSAVFLMTTPFEAGIDAEVKQGITAIDALKAADVPHIVFSSVSDAVKKTGIPHFESKYQVEEHLKASGIPYTITAPVYFMSNLFAPWNTEHVTKNKFPFPMSPDTKLQMVSLRDIGHFNSVILGEPAKYDGRRIDYAGDSVSGVEAAAILTKVSGKAFEFLKTDIEVFRAFSEDSAIMFEWFESTGYSVDMEGLRKEFPSVGWQSFEEWAKEQNWESIKKD